MLLATLLGAATLLSACGNGGFAYVSSSDRKSYFKVPANWKFFDKRQILVANGQSLSPATDRQFPWLIGFDSDPKPAIDHVISAGQVYPVVRAQVQDIAGTFATRDQLSLEGLRNSLYPVDEWLQSNRAEILDYSDIVLPDGFHGIDMVYDLILGGVSGVGGVNAVVRVHQKTVVDPAMSRLYQFWLQCESHCYRDNKSLLDQIADSWTVKER